MSLYRVMVEVDEDAKVWVASGESDRAWKLATSADAFEDLIGKLEEVNHSRSSLLKNGLFAKDSTFDIHT